MVEILNGCYKEKVVIDNEVGWFEFDNVFFDFVMIVVIYYFISNIEVYFGEQGGLIFDMWLIELDFVFFIYRFDLQVVVQDYFGINVLGDKFVNFGEFIFVDIWV